jgi:hypothetical protein
VVQSGLIRIFDIDNCLLKRMDFTLYVMAFKNNNSKMPGESFLYLHVILKITFVEYVLNILCKSDSVKII